MKNSLEGFKGRFQQQSVNLKTEEQKLPSLKNRKKKTEEK